MTCLSTLGLIMTGSIVAAFGKERPQNLCCTGRLHQKEVVERPGPALFEFVHVRKWVSVFEVPLRDRFPIRDEFTDEGGEVGYLSRQVGFIHYRVLLKPQRCRPLYLCVSSGPSNPSIRTS